MGREQHNPSCPPSKQPAWSFLTRPVCLGELLNQGGNRMALFPCSLCRKRPKGRLNAAYLAVLHGSDAERAKFRLCAGCFNETQETWLTRLDSVDPDSDQAFPEATACHGCGQPGTDLAPAFATTYQRGSERNDFYGYLDGNCESLFLGLLPVPVATGGAASKRPK